MVINDSKIQKKKKLLAFYHHHHHGKCKKKASLPVHTILGAGGFAYLNPRYLIITTVCILVLTVILILPSFCLCDIVTSLSTLQ